MKCAKCVTRSRPIYAEDKEEEEEEAEEEEEEAVVAFGVVVEVVAGTICMTLPTCGATSATRHKLIPTWMCITVYVHVIECATLNLYDVVSLCRVQRVAPGPRHPACSGPTAHVILEYTVQTLEVAHKTVVCHKILFRVHELRPFAHVRLLHMKTFAACARHSGQVISEDVELAKKCRQALTSTWSDGDPTAGVT